MGGVQPRFGSRTVTTAGVGLVLVVALVVGPSGAAGNTEALSGVVDLSVDMAVHPNPAAAGSVIQYESRIRNRGTLVAEAVQAVFEISAANVRVETGSGSCTTASSMRLERDGSTEDQPWTVTCDLGALAPGIEAGIALTVTTGTPGTQMSVVTVSSGGADSRPSDNRVETPVFVLPDTPGFTAAFQQPGRSNPFGRATT